MTHPITIYHLFMRVSDLARARAFWVDTLGL
jgi:catechol 2,3-dioxygenase-like lactoylglutathione lyase family enzyme